MIMRAGRRSKAQPPKSETKLSVVRSVDDRLHNGKLKTKPLPIGTFGKRSSQPVINAGYNGSKLYQVESEFNLAVLDHMEYLVSTNEEFSHAVDNIVQMANTKHHIIFPDNIPQEQQKEMRLFLKLEEKKWYNYSSGSHSLKADLLVQTVLFGALSAEVVLQSKRNLLDSVQQIVRVGPKHIRFVYDNSNSTFEPYQVPKTFTSRSNVNGMIKLNTNTYKYIAHRRYFDSPYPLPPFITSIRAIAIRDTMVNNFAEVMKQLGVLGFLEALVEPPEQLTGEDDDAYWTRANQFLDDHVYPQLEKTLGANMVAGFKETHTFNLTGNTMNVTGAEGLMKIVDMIIFSGLKQDPNMLGRNYSTTETFGRVILEMLISQCAEYQRIVDSFFAHAYTLSLKSAGYVLDFLDVESESPTVRDRKAQAEAEEIEQRIAFKDYNQGITNQDQVAIERDRDKPAEQEPRFSMDQGPDNGNDPNAPKPPNKKTTGDDTTDETKNASPGMISIMESSLGFDSDNLYPYDVPTLCLQENHDFRVVTLGKTDSQYDKNVKRYFNATFRNYSKSIQKAIARMESRLEKMNSSDTLKLIQDNLWFELIKEWSNDFVAPQESITGDHIEDIYGQFRRRKDMFFSRDNSGVVQFDGTEDDIPDAIFDFDDMRAIEYYKNVDTTYLGKFITDPDTKKKVYKYIGDEYISGNLPIGNNLSNQKRFSQALFGLLEGEGYKIRRIVETTVNGLRNDASINYMDQHSVVTEYEIFEIMDNRTCEYCAHMDGKTFRVAEAKKLSKRKHASSPSTIKQISPFATTIKIDDFKTMDEAALQSANIMKPSFHPLCRGTVVAVF